MQFDQRELYNWLSLDSLEVQEMATAAATAECYRYSFCQGPRRTISSRRDYTGTHKHEPTKGIGGLFLRKVLVSIPLKWREIDLEVATKS